MARVYPLNPMQLRFVREYIKDPINATAAAKRAGYSFSTAAHHASKLLADPRVQLLLEEASEKAISNLAITKERVLQELWLIATANPKDAITIGPDGEPEVNIAGMANDIAAAQEIIISKTTGSKNTKNITVKGPKTADKVAALVRIGQHLGMFKEQVEVTHTSLEKLIEASMGPEMIQDRSNEIEGEYQEVPNIEDNYGITTGLEQPDDSETVETPSETAASN